MKPDGFDLLWEEGSCFVVAKPGGILTQSPPGIDSLELRVKEFLRLRDARVDKVYLGVPHRIDRPASGALVMARTRRAARRLSEQFEDRTVEKTYWALVEGCVTPPCGTWDDMIRKVPGEARAEIVEAGDPGGRTAVLHYRVLERAVPASLPSTTWMEIQLETGRTHQIRVQLSHRGHPIVGDSQYGSRRLFGPETDDMRRRWIALHARELQFHHPNTRERIQVKAPLPKYWSLGV